VEQLEGPAEASEGDHDGERGGGEAEGHDGDGGGFASAWLGDSGGPWHGPGNVWLGSGGLDGGGASFDGDLALGDVGDGDGDLPPQAMRSINDSLPMAAAEQGQLLGVA
jgi:hypothetical protein